VIQTKNSTVCGTERGGVRTGFAVMLKLAV